MIINNNQLLLRVNISTRDISTCRYLAYGARTIWQGWDHAGMFIVLAPVQTDKTKESIEKAFMPRVKRLQEVLIR